MANILKVEKESISADGLTLTIGDNTGNYDVTTNPGGYGAPNDVRSDLYLKLFVTLKKTSGDEQITVSAYNENTADTWTVGITEDGYYEIYLYACKVWSAVITYAANQVVYYASTDKFYYSIAGGNLNNLPTDTGDWTEVTDVSQLKAAIATSQANTYADVYEYIELYNSRVIKARAYYQEDGSCGKCGSCGTSLYQKIRNLVDGAAINEALTAYARAQVQVEEIQALAQEVENNEE